MIFNKGFIGLMSVLLLASCNKPDSPDCFKRTGEEITLTRYPGIFKNVVLNGDMDLTLVQGNDIKIEITAGNNLQEKIITSVNDGVLEIENNNRCNFVRGYKKRIQLRLTLPHLRYLHNKGVGKISTEGSFLQDSLELNTESVGDIELQGEFNELVVNTGSHGDVYVYGKSNRLYIYSAGVNYVYTEKLKVKDYVFVNTNNLGDCYVNVDQSTKFEYLITNSGNIYYSGTAAVTMNLGDGSAKGKLIQKN